MVTITGSVLVGCASDEAANDSNQGVIDSEPPAIANTTPAIGAAGVPISDSIHVRFSELIDSSTLTSESFMVSADNHSIDGVLSVGTSVDPSSKPITTATFSPAGKLAPGTTYTCRVTDGVRDLAGNNLGAEYVWSFTTHVPPITSAIEDITASYRDSGPLPSFQVLGSTLVITERIGTTNSCDILGGNVRVEGFQIVVELEPVNPHPPGVFCLMVMLSRVGRVTLEALPVGEYSVKLITPERTMNTTIWIKP
ncbi:MAG: Ig-like domain-containing protein [Nitrospirota bacterium]